MKSHDLFGETQADTGPVLLGREKGKEDFLHDLLVDTDPVIRYRDRYPAVIIQIRFKFDPSGWMVPPGIGPIRRRLCSCLGDQHWPVSLAQERPDQISRQSSH